MANSDAGPKTGIEDAEICITAYPAMHLLLVGAATNGDRIIEQGNYEAGEYGVIGDNYGDPHHDFPLA